MRDLIAEFKAFAIKGNFIELAVAFILGVAFQAVIVSLVDNIFMPIIGAIVGNESLGAKTFEIGGVAIGYGAFLAALINFLLIALILFIVIKAYNRMRTQEEETVTTKPCDFCATDIPLAATRCPNCTSELSASAGIAD